MSTFLKNEYPYPGYPRSGWKAMSGKKERERKEINVSDNNGQLRLQPPPRVAKWHKQAVWTKNRTIVSDNNGQVKDWTKISNSILENRPQSCPNKLGWAEPQPAISWLAEKLVQVSDTDHCNHRLSLSFFLSSSLYVYCFWPTSGKLPRLKFCFPPYCGIIRRTI